MPKNTLSRSKGRTYRHRKKYRTKIRSYNASSDNNLIDLTKWMKANKWSPAHQLQPTVFPVTGRGIMAKKTINVNDIIVSIPKKLLITSRTVMESNIGCIFHGIHDLIYPTCQQVLSTFLAIEKRHFNESAWFEYIATIPRSFSTPFYCSKDEVLPDYITTKFKIMKETVQKSYSLVLSQIQCHSMPELYWEDFLWAWCAVNSRAVYYKSEVKSCIIKDRDCLALAPYLDLLNHSPSVLANQVQWENGHYELKSSSCFKEHEQV